MQLDKLRLFLLLFQVDYQAKNDHKLNQIQLQESADLFSNVWSDRNCQLIFLSGQIKTIPSYFIFYVNTPLSDFKYERTSRAVLGGKGPVDYVNSNVEPMLNLSPQKG